MQVTTSYVRNYESVKASGKLRGIALEVFGIVCASPGLTVGEIWRRYAENQLLLSKAARRSRGEISKRVSDLTNWGAIKADGLTICPESGRKAQRWVPTGAMPAPVRGAKFQVVPKTPYPLSPDGGADRIQRLLDLSEQLMKQRDEAAQQLVNVRGEREADGQLIAQLRSDLASTRARQATELSNANTNRNLATERAERAELKARQLEADMRQLAHRSVELTGRHEEYVRQRMGELGWDGRRVVEQAVATYQAFVAGELVERRKRVEEMKSPVGVQAKEQLQALASRAKLVLRWRRFLPKRMVRQAEDTLKALNFAVTNL